MHYQVTYDRTIKQTAVFGELSFDLTEDWTVTGGARWFEYERDTFERRQLPLGYPIDSDFSGRGGVVESEGKDSDTVLKFSTQYRFSDTKMVYALYSEGFRLGGNNDPRAAASGILPLEYKPDTLQNYEVGFKTRWLDQSLQLNMTAFFMEWEDIQLNRSGSTAGNPWWMRGTFNGGKAEQKGIELSVGWYPTDNFSIDASAFLADPEFSEDTFAPDGVLDDTGRDAPCRSRRRKSTGSRRATRSRTFSARRATYGRGSRGVTSRRSGTTWARSTDFTPKTPGDRANGLEELIPSYTSTTLQFGFTHDNGWETALVVRNLFDERGVNWMSSSDYSTGPDELSCLAGDDRWKHVRSLQRPRTIGLSFSKKW